MLAVYLFEQYFRFCVIYVLGYLPKSFLQEFLNKHSYCICTVYSINYSVKNGGNTGIFKQYTFLMLFLSIINCFGLIFILFFSAYFQWRVHQGDEQGLAWSTLLLLAMRRKFDGSTLRPAR